MTILRGSATDDLNILDLQTSGFDATLNIGTSSNRFAATTVQGAISIGSSKLLSVYSNSIAVNGPITTSGGALTLDAQNGITISQPIITNGGNQTLNADADGNGTGALFLDFQLAEFIDPNPAAGNQFGHSVEILTSGNAVVTSPFDDFGGTDAGAVYLFNGLTGEVISTLRGSSAGDNVGAQAISVLTNGNYLITSVNWDNGTVIDAGAVTWGNGSTGINGTVSASNSLVGTSNYDFVGSNGVIALTNGNYVVRSLSGTTEPQSKPEL